MCCSRPCACVREGANRACLKHAMYTHTLAPTSVKEPRHTQDVIPGTSPPMPTLAPIRNEKTHPQHARNSRGFACQSKAPVRDGFTCREVRRASKRQHYFGPWAMVLQAANTSEPSPAGSSRPTCTMARTPASARTPTSADDIDTLPRVVLQGLMTRPPANQTAPLVDLRLDRHDRQSLPIKTLVPPPTASSRRLPSTGPAMYLAKCSRCVQPQTTGFPMRHQASFALNSRSLRSRHQSLARSQRSGVRHISGAHFLAAFGSFVRLMPLTISSACFGLARKTNPHSFRYAILFRMTSAFWSPHRTPHLRWDRNRRRRSELGPFLSFPFVAQC